MDLATIIGIMGGLACVFVPMAMGGDVAAFIDVPSLMITVGGMLSATLIHFSLKQFLTVFALFKKTLFYRLPTEQELMQKIVNYAAINRRDGALALEKQMSDAGDLFLVKGLQMIIDGQTEENVASQLSMEIQYLQERHQTGKKIMEFMGSMAPAFGMVGTLIGLVQMLGAMESPDQIGSGMAVALITTFYGSFLANLVFIPMAGKLGMNSKRETILREMILEGVIGIVRGQSPTEVREVMQAFISVKHREEIKPNI